LARLDRSPHFCRSDTIPVQQESTRCKVIKILGSVFRLQVRLVLDGTRHPGIAGSASLGRGPTKVSHAPSSTCSTRRMRSKPVARRVAQGKAITPLSCLQNAVPAWHPEKSVSKVVFLYYPNVRLACIFNLNITHNSEITFTSISEVRSIPV